MNTLLHHIFDKMQYQVYSVDIVLSGEFPRHNPWTYPWFMGVMCSQILPPRQGLHSHLPPIRRKGIPMPNTQYTKPLRRSASSKVKEHSFTGKQIRAAFRRIAGIFNDDRDRTIRPRYRGANVHGAVRDLVIQRAHPVQGLEREDVHGALFGQAFDLLVEDGVVTIEGDHAEMDAVFAEKQKGISNHLRNEAKKEHSVPKTKHRDNGRRGVNQRKKYNRRQLVAD